MKIAFRGIYTLDEFFQALYQEHHNLAELGITHVRGASLYYTPVDQHGDEVVPRHRGGRPILGWDSDGPYRSAAEDFGL